MPFNLDNIQIELSDFWTILMIIIDITLVWGVLYFILRIVRKSVKTLQIFKGIIIIILIKIVSSLLGLNTLGWLADNVLTWGFLAIIIIFQPEIRNLLEKIGQTQIFSNFNTLTLTEKEMLVNEIVNAVFELSLNKIGALICFEKAQSLVDYIETGTQINALVKSELLISIFTPPSPLHDGAVIIQGNKMSCASAYFPPTTQEMPVKYGARHRAALGISEVTDSLTIVISEESGGVSIASNSKLTPVSLEGFKQILMEHVGVFYEDDDMEGDFVNG